MNPRPKKQPGAQSLRVDCHISAQIWIFRNTCSTAICVLGNHYFLCVKYFAAQLAASQEELSSMSV
jgi:hypothetical protein